MRVPARLTDALGGGSCSVDGDVADDDVATLRAEPNGRGCPDTGRTTGHDRNPASQSLQGHSRSHLSLVIAAQRPTLQRISLVLYSRIVFL
jgi:hypothetical protein